MGRLEQIEDNAKMTKDGVLIPMDDFEWLTQQAPFYRMKDFTKAEKDYYFDIAAQHDISKATVRERVDSQHWDIWDAVTQPIRRYKRSKSKESQRVLTDAEIRKMKRNNLAFQTVYYRLNNGWDRKAALTKPSMRKNT